MIELAVICGLQVILIGWLVVDRRLERQEVARERGDLLQRISAPEYAAMKHYNHDQPQMAPPAINPDIDEDYWVSKEDLAEMMAHDEANRGD